MSESPYSDVRDPAYLPDPRGSGAGQLVVVALAALEDVLQEGEVSGNFQRTHREHDLLAVLVVLEDRGSALGTEASPRFLGRLVPFELVGALGDLEVGQLSDRIGREVSVPTAAVAAVAVDHAREFSSDLVTNRPAMAATPNCFRHGSPFFVTDGELPIERKSPSQAARTIAPIRVSCTEQRRFRRREPMPIPPGGWSRWVANYKFSLEKRHFGSLAPDGVLPYTFPP